MAKGPIWTDEEKMFLTGVLENNGEKVRSWPDDVKAYVRERLASRSDDAIYQQCRELIKARKIAASVQTPQEEGFFMARGA